MDILRGYSHQRTKVHPSMASQRCILVLKTHLWYYHCGKQSCKQFWLFSTKTCCNPSQFETVCPLYHIIPREFFLYWLVGDIKHIDLNLLTYNDIYIPRTFITMKKEGFMLWPKKTRVSHVKPGFWSLGISMHSKVHGIRLYDIGDHYSINIKWVKMVQSQ